MLLALLLAGLASAQSPDDAWRTVETDHYRVHYPVEFEVWALRAAARLDDGRERVVEIVGFDPQQKVDVLVMDPVAEANAMALPLTRTPRMVLWTHPPEPDSVIGHYTDWTDELILHEDTHLVHMLRPSRAPLPGLFYGLVGVGPIAIKAPRWVTEGYATVAEGQLTGAGRPYSDLRIAILRRWAQEGALPTYGQLAADGESFMGMSMAYLAGSAYLQWLVDNSHEDALRDLWARMSARQDRSFDKAFEGVFGDSPRALYERFTAELTWASMGIERDVEPVEGELFRELSQYTDLPVISPDGSARSAAGASDHANRTGSAPAAAYGSGAGWGRRGRRRALGCCTRGAAGAAALLVADRVRSE